VDKDRKNKKEKVRKIEKGRERFIKAKEKKSEKDR